MQTVVISRRSESEWSAVENDREVGRGDASRRPDGRIFVSIDAWHDSVFDRIAETMLTDLPRPLYTLVDEGEPDPWQPAGFAVLRREWQYIVPTAGVGPVPPPADVTIVPGG